MTYNFTVTGKKETSESPVMHYGNPYTKSYFKVWIHIHEGKQYQAGETLSVEELGQIMGGN